MKQFLWKWKLFWGNCYKVYNQETLEKTILVYHKKIYILKESKGE